MIIEAHKDECGTYREIVVPDRGSGIDKETSRKPGQTIPDEVGRQCDQNLISEACVRVRKKVGKYKGNVSPVAHDCRASEPRKQITNNSHLVEVQRKILDPNNLCNVNRWKVEGKKMEGRTLFLKSMWIGRRINK
jgi:hypothetical protein